MKETIVTVDIHLCDESDISSMTMDAGSMHWETLLIDGSMVYINSREQAEKLYQAVWDLTERWRDRDPEHFRADAIVAPDPDILRRAREWAAGEGPRVPAVMTDEEVIERYSYHYQKMSES